MYKLSVLAANTMIRWNYFFYFMVLTLSLVTPSMAISQSYSAGYSKYVQGDFEGAEKAFQITLNKRLTTAEKARIYKMLGITQYMQGKRIAAESSFQQAKKLNPFINISPSEVLDESVVTFFETIQAPKGPTAPPVAKKEPSQETFLKVYANPSYAQVAVDGVNLGRAGGLIKVTPGFHNIEVSAKNYKTHSQPIDVKKGQVNNISITLIKITEKTTPKPAPVKAAEPPAVSKERKAKVKKVKKRKPTKPTRPKQVKKVRKKRKRYVKTVKPSGSGKMTFFHFLPFGAGQYINNDTGLGIAFSITQAIGFSYGTYLWFIDAESFVAESDRNIEDMEQQNLQDNPNVESQAWQQRNREIIDYAEGREAQLASIYQRSIIINSISGAIWFAGIIHAYIKVKKNGTRSSASIKPFDETERQKKFFEQRSHLVKPTLSLDLKPSLSPKVSPQQSDVSLLLDLTLDF